jgi:ecotin
MKSIGLLAVLAAALVPGISAGQNQDNMQAYPASIEGLTRMVFRVPAVENEDDHLVEIMIGKTMEVDCNNTAFGGNLEERVAEGWGYPYYVLEKAGGPMSTMMACPPGQEKTEAFVMVRGEGFRLRYNSKLPVVTFVTDGFEVGYRIWTAGEDIGHATQE